MGVIRCPNDVKVYTAPLCSSYSMDKHRVLHYPGKGLRELQLHLQNIIYVDGLSVYFPYE